MTSFISDLNSTDPKDPLHKWRRLTLIVRANPKELTTHTQRIMLAMDIHLQPYLSGALQDFFITLKTTGRPIKEKMFNLTSPLLNVSNRAYFRQWLKEGTDNNLDCIGYPGATLISDTCQKVHIDNDEEDEATILEAFLNKNYDNPIDKARYCVAYGNIEEGQKLLELQILSTQKKQPLVEQELLGFYYYSQNKEALEAMTQSLLKADRPLSENWKKIQSIAKEW
ncbi:MAG TPA: hypothetical protein ENJ51_04710 [Leucothrix mucor]|uniref:Uncharacterized protein n=1 Tax=Leucothrix mucor TaxID=45248 RepID=A0A7V2SZR5_LEUMU|nr:hypothetical protein [Leucothrix mucor]